MYILVLRSVQSTIAILEPILCLPRCGTSPDAGCFCFRYQLAAVRAEIEGSAEIQKLFKETYAKQLRKEWKGIADGKGPMKVEGKEVINMEMFCSVGCSPLC